MAGKLRDTIYGSKDANNQYIINFFTTPLKPYHEDNQRYSKIDNVIRAMLGVSNTTTGLELIRKKIAIIHERLHKWCNRIYINEKYVLNQFISTLVVHPSISTSLVGHMVKTPRNRFTEINDQKQRQLVNAVSTNDVIFLYKLLRQEPNALNQIISLRRLNELLQEFRENYYDGYTYQLARFDFITTEVIYGIPRVLLSEEKQHIREEITNYARAVIVLSSYNSVYTSIRQEQEEDEEEEEDLMEEDEKDFKTYIRRLVFLYNRFAEEEYINIPELVNVIMTHKQEEHLNFKNIDIYYPTIVLILANGIYDMLITPKTLRYTGKYTRAELETKTRIKKRDPYIICLLQDILDKHLDEKIQDIVDRLIYVCLAFKTYL